MLYLDQQGGTDYDTMQDLPLPLGHRIDIAATETLSNNPIAMGFAALRNYGLNNDDTPKLDAASVTGLAKEYGVEGKALPGDQYNEAAARSIYERQRLTARAQAIDSQVNYSWSGTPLMALANTAAMISDPLNLAAMFIPVAGEEYFAGRLAAQAGALGRFGVRATEGAVQGGIGMGVLEAASYPLHQALHDDYTATDSLVNMLAGAGIGAALHGLGGALLDKLRGIDTTNPETAQAAARAALAQTLQDQPVNVSPVYNGPALWRTLTIQTIGDRVQAQADRLDRLHGEDLMQREQDRAKAAQLDAMLAESRPAAQQFSVDMAAKSEPAGGLENAMQRALRESGMLKEGTMQAALRKAGLLEPPPPPEYLPPPLSAEPTGLAPPAPVRDPLYAEAVQITRSEGSPSPRSLQYQLDIGPERAAEMINQMERDGILGALKRDVPEVYQPDVSELPPHLSAEIERILAEQRAEIESNAQSSTSLGDAPAREPLSRPEPVAKPGEPERMSDALTSRATEAQAKAADAEKNLADAIQGLKDSGYLVRAAPELAAADEGIAAARQEADAINRLAVCMERQ